MIYGDTVPWSLDVGLKIQILKLQHPVYRDPCTVTLLRFVENSFATILAYTVPFIETRHLPGL